MSGGVPGGSVAGDAAVAATGSAAFAGVACSSAKADAGPAMENTMAIARIECFIEFTSVTRLQGS
jgi:hypothetical protein